MAIGTRRLLTVIDVIQTFMRIIRIIYNKSSTQAITVLVVEMTMIPECALKGSQGELVYSPATQARGNTAWLNALNWYKKLSSGTRGHWVTKAGPSTKFVCLWKMPCQCCRGNRSHSLQAHQKGGTHTIEAPKSIDLSVSWSMTLIENSAPC
jgi:hypothetical protein